MKKKKSSTRNTFSKFSPWSFLFKAIHQFCLKVILLNLVFLFPQASYAVRDTHTSRSPPSIVKPKQVPRENSRITPPPVQIREAQEPMAAPAPIGSTPSEPLAPQAPPTPRPVPHPYAAFGPLGEALWSTIVPEPQVRAYQIPVNPIPPRSSPAPIGSTPSEPLAPQVPPAPRPVPQPFVEIGPEGETLWPTGAPRPRITAYQIPDIPIPPRRSPPLQVFAPSASDLQYEQDLQTHKEKFLNEKKAIYDKLLKGARGDAKDKIRKNSYNLFWGTTLFILTLVPFWNVFSETIKAEATPAAITNLWGVASAISTIYLKEMLSSAYKIYKANGERKKVDAVPEDWPIRVLPGNLEDLAGLLAIVEILKNDEQNYADWPPSKKAALKNSFGAKIVEILVNFDYARIDINFFERETLHPTFHSENYHYVLEALQRSVKYIDSMYLPEAEAPQHRFIAFLRSHFPTKYLFAEQRNYDHPLYKLIKGVEGVRFLRDFSLVTAFKHTVKGSAVLSRRADAPVPDPDYQSVIPDDFQKTSSKRVFEEGAMFPGDFKFEEYRDGFKKLEDILNAHYKILKTKAREKDYEEIKSSLKHLAYFSTIGIFTSLPYWHLGELMHGIIHGEGHHESPLPPPPGIPSATPIPVPVTAHDAHEHEASAVAAVSALTVIISSYAARGFANSVWDLARASCRFIDVRDFHLTRQAPSLPVNLMNLSDLVTLQKILVDSTHPYNNWPLEARQAVRVSFGERSAQILINQLGLRVSELYHIPSIFAPDFFLREYDYIIAVYQKTIKQLEAFDSEDREDKILYRRFPHIEGAKLMRDNLEILFVKNLIENNHELRRNLAQAQAAGGNAGAQASLHRQAALQLESEDHEAHRPVEQAHHGLVEGGPDTQIGVIEATAGGS